MTAQNNPTKPANHILPEEMVCLNEWQSFENAGDSITGEYLGYELVIINEKPVAQHTVLTTEGIATFNETSQLLRLRTIPVGSIIMVLYCGEGEKVQGCNRIKLFKIGILKSDFQQVKSSIIDTARNRQIEARKEQPIRVIEAEVTSRSISDEEDPFLNDRYEPSNK